MSSVGSNWGANDTPDKVCSFSSFFYLLDIFWQDLDEIYSMT